MPPPDRAVEPPNCADFSTISVSRPSASALSAAVMPPPPEPTTSTSTSWSKPGSVIKRSPPFAPRTLRSALARPGSSAAWSRTVPGWPAPRRQPATCGPRARSCPPRRRPTRSTRRRPRRPRLASRSSSSALSQSGLSGRSAPTPLAKSCAAVITAACRALRCSAVIGSPCTMRPSAAGGAVAKVGTGGSCDSPPDPTMRTRFPRVATKWPTAVPSALRPLAAARAAWRRELTKTGSTGTWATSPNSACRGWTVPWSTSMLAETAMSTPASHSASAQCGRDVGGHVQRSRVGAVVADADGRGADAERRHEPVEEPVVVVR